MRVCRRQQVYLNKKVNRFRCWHISIPRDFDISNDGTKVLIGLGSSLGMRHHHLQKGLLLMAHDPGIDLITTSSVWQTMPIGAAKSPFYNMCAVIRTRYTPVDLMHRLLSIEKRCDRLRGIHWMDRTLDLDVLLYGEHVVNTIGIQVPHPRMLEREFVMQPAKEIAGDWIHPIADNIIANLAGEFASGMWRVGRFSIAYKN